jgi:adenylate kinase family enzyme
MPQHLALKVAFIGYTFAGKKTQAATLAKSYGLQTFKMSDLVDEAIAFSESHPEPIPA